MSYQYRYFNDRSVEQFGTWLAGKDWAEVVKAVGSNNKANCYQAAVTEALDAFFPLITVRKKSTDCPWKLIR